MRINSLGSLRYEITKRNQFIHPYMIDEHVWEDIEWDFARPEERSFILSRLLVPLVEQVKTHDLYAEAYREVDIAALKKLERVEDILLSLPILFKDSTSFGAEGLRGKVKKNPAIMKHGGQDTHGEIFRSGGTKGVPTPTYITTEDLRLESRALGRRTFIPGGFQEGDRLYSTYNLAHKGGRAISLAGRFVGMEVITRRPEDSVEDVIELIKDYKVNALAAVQPPLSQEAGEKGSGVTFLSIYKERADLFGAEGLIKKAFITGFPIPESVINLSKEIGLSLFTTYGCTEFIPLGTSTVEGDLCAFNDQHLLFGPHVVMIVRQEGDKLVSVKEGEMGMVLVTTIGVYSGRTIYLNYALGDTAVLKHEAGRCSCGRTTPVIGGIMRMDHPGELVSGGCRYV